MLDSGVQRTACTSRPEEPILSDIENDQGASTQRTTECICYVRAFRECICYVRPAFPCLSSGQCHLYHVQHVQSQTARRRADDYLDCLD